MPLTLNFSDTGPSTADGFDEQIAPALLALTGGSAPSALQPGAYGIYRYATSYAPTGAATVVDLFTYGGYSNPGLWQMVTYSCSSGVLSLPSVLVNSGCQPAGSQGQQVGQAPALLALTGGSQGTYGSGVPWFRFATNFAPANGANCADLVMPGGISDQSRWYVVTYQVSSGALT